MRKIVYVLTRRLTERNLDHAIVHDGLCWHIEGAMARGEVTALSDGFALAAGMIRCADCKP